MIRKGCWYSSQMFRGLLLLVLHIICCIYAMNLMRLVANYFSYHITLIAALGIDLVLSSANVLCPGLSFK